MQDNITIEIWAFSSNYVHFIDILNVYVKVNTSFLTKMQNFNILLEKIILLSNISYKLFSQTSINIFNLILKAYFNALINTLIFVSLILINTKVVFHNYSPPAHELQDSFIHYHEVNKPF